MEKVKAENNEVKTTKEETTTAKEVPGTAEIRGPAVVTEVVDVTAKVVNAISTGIEKTGSGPASATACGDAGVAKVVAEVGLVLVLKSGEPTVIYATLRLYVDAEKTPLAPKQPDPRNFMGRVPSLAGRKPTQSEDRKTTTGKATGSAALI